MAAVVEKRPFWWNLFPPDLSGGLIIIILFLALIAIGNILNTYNALKATEDSQALWSAAATACYILPTYGLFRLKRWARWFEIVFSLILVVLGLVVLVFSSFIVGLFIIVIHGLIARYLLSAKGRRAFYPPPVTD